jgi:hypothetical protein
MGYDPKLEAQIHAVSNGRPFGTCKMCNLRQIIPSKVNCPECERLLAMKMAVPQDAGAGVKDTQNDQSNTAFDHSGYRDTIPSQKFPPKKERV